MYEAKIIADSFNPAGNRITTVQTRYWRAIHAELMTHRAFSRNASSSRAIPVQTMLKQVWKDPAGPLHWGVNQPGMQARAEMVGWRRAAAGALWRGAAKMACGFAWGLMKLGTHKQVANRLLEPFQYISVIITATDWDNFFLLRDHEDAQPEIQHLAKCIKTAMNASFPRKLAAGDWHLPYITDEDREAAYIARKKNRITRDEPNHEEISALLVKLSVARCARVSYLTHDGKTPSLRKDIELHDRLVVSRPIHASPAEHQAMAMHGSLRYRNLVGWAQYRIELEKQV